MRDTLCNNMVTESNDNEGSSSRSAGEVDVKGNICVICMESVSSSKRGIMDSCDHKFCSGCIQKWKSIKSTCPMCRGTIGAVYTLSHHRWIDSEDAPEVQRRCIDCKQFYEDLLVRCSTCELQACAWCNGGWHCNLCKMHAGNPAFNNHYAANQFDAPESHEGEGSSSTGAGEVYPLDSSGQISNRLLRESRSPVSGSDDEEGLLEPPFVVTYPTTETESSLNGMDEERKFTCVKCGESYPLDERGIKASCAHECCFCCIRQAGENVFICPVCGGEVLHASKHSKDGKVEELWSAPPRCSICKNYREDDYEMLVNCSTCEDKFHADCMEAVITCNCCGRLSHIRCEKWHCGVVCRSYVINVDGYQELCG